MSESMSRALARLSSVFMVGLLLSACGEPPVRNNVLVLVADTLRADVLGCYGGEAKTPNLDWLAAQGVLMERAYSTSPMTMPSSVSMLTGTCPSIYRAGEIPGALALPNYHVPDDTRLLAEELRDSGYDMRMKLENKTAGLFNNFQGFDKVRPFEELTAEEVGRVEQESGIRQRPPRYKKLYGLLDGLLKVTDQQPFFQLYWLLDPHSPYDPPAKFRDRMQLDPASLPKSEGTYVELRLVSKKTVGDWSAREQEHLKQLYIREVESIDERIGYMFEALRKNGQLENTLILFTSDHGEAFDDHGEWGHGQDFFEDLVHIPLIVAGPGIARGRRERASVSHIDLVATLVDLLGIEFDNIGQGRSFAGLLRGQGGGDRGPIYFEQGGERCDQRDGLLVGDLKLITFKDGGRLLFDLATDPGESRDLSAERPDELQRMMEVIERIRTQNDKRRQQFADLIRANEGGGETDAATLEHMRELGYIR